MNDFSWLPTEFHCCSGARDDQIAESETQLGRVLPPDYVEFLRVSNGGEGFIGIEQRPVTSGVGIRGGGRQGDRNRSGKRGG